MLLAALGVAVGGACNGGSSDAPTAAATAPGMVFPTATPPGGPSPTATVPILPPLPPDPADASTDLYFIYKWAEDIKPHYDQVIADILIGPDVVPKWCPAGVKVNRLPLEAAVGTRLEFDPAYLPEDTRESEDEAGLSGCGDVPVHLERHYWQRGNAVRYGGFVHIRRTLTSEPAVQVRRPAERMKQGQIAGLPAVIVEPMLPEPYQHWTEVTIAVWDEQANVFSVVETTGFTLDETIRIAEGLFRD
jgi:hypothetical protein